MTSEYPRREERPERRLSPEDQARLEEIAFHVTHIFGGLREGIAWSMLFAHFVKLEKLLQWARSADIDMRTVVQADGNAINAKVQDMLSDEGYFTDPRSQAPDFPPEEWGKS